MFRPGPVFQRQKSGPVAGNTATSPRIRGRTGSIAETRTQGNRFLRSAVVRVRAHNRGAGSDCLSFGGIRTARFNPGPSVFRIFCSTRLDDSSLPRATYHLNWLRARLCVRLRWRTRTGGYVTHRSRTQPAVPVCHPDEAESSASPKTPEEGPKCGVSTGCSGRDRNG
jgi:hypothetical protein